MMLLHNVVTFHAFIHLSFNLTLFMRFFRDSYNVMLKCMFKKISANTYNMWLTVSNSEMKMLFLIIKATIKNFKIINFNNEIGIFC